MEYIQKIGIGSDGQMVVPKFTSDEQVGLTTESGSLLFNTETNTIQYYNGSSWKQAVYTSTLNNDTWYHLTGTYDGTNLKAYLNGSLEAITPPLVIADLLRIFG